MAKRSVVRSAWAAMVVSGCLFSTACGVRRIDGDTVEKFLSEKLAEAFGVAPTGVSCPDDIGVKKDTSFRCTAGFAGNVSATITLTQTDDKGYVQITQVDGISGAKPIEADIVQRSAKDMGVSVTADCGAKLRAVKTGDSFECMLTPTSGGTSMPVTVRFTDDHGGYEWKPTHADEPQPL